MSDRKIEIGNFVHSKVSVDGSRGLDPKTRDLTLADHVLSSTQVGMACIIKAQTRGPEGRVYLESIVNEEGNEVGSRATIPSWFLSWIEKVSQPHPIYRQRSQVVKNPTARYQEFRV